MLPQIVECGQGVLVADHVQPLGHVGDVDIPLDDIPDHLIHRRLVFLFFKVGPHFDGPGGAAGGDRGEALADGLGDLLPEAVQKRLGGLGHPAGGQPHPLFPAVLNDQQIVKDHPGLGDGLRVGLLGGHPHVLPSVVIGEVADGPGDHGQAGLIFVPVGAEIVLETVLEGAPGLGLTVPGEGTVILLDKGLIGLQADDGPPAQFAHQGGVQKGAVRLMADQTEQVRCGDVGGQFQSDAIHARTPPISAIRQKFSSSSWPYSVKTASGWNCTPNRGRVRWDRPITAPSSATQST